MSRHSKIPERYIGLIHGPAPDGERWSVYSERARTDRKLTDAVAAAWAAGIAGPRHARGDLHPAQDPESQAGLVYCGGTGNHWYRLLIRTTSDGWLQYKVGVPIWPRVRSAPVRRW